jgi:hypothetical protein
VRSYRRMAAVAVLGALAAAALSSCGMNPDVAATVGSTKITEKQVDQAESSIKGQLSRAEIVQDLVLATACRNYAKAHSVSYDTAAMAKNFEQQGAPAGAYVNALAERNACLTAVSPEAESQPTDAELHKLYDDLVKLDPSSGTTPFDQAKQQFLQIPRVTQVFALVHGYAKISQGQKISVNPRYRTLSIALQTNTGHVLVDVPIGELSNTAVTDAPQPPSPSPSEEAPVPPAS